MEFSDDEIFLLTHINIGLPSSSVESWTDFDQNNKDEYSERLK